MLTYILAPAHQELVRHRQSDGPAERRHNQPEQAKSSGAGGGWRDLVDSLDDNHSNHFSREPLKDDPGECVYTLIIAFGGKGQKTHSDGETPMYETHNSRINIIINFGYRKKGGAPNS